MPSLKELDYIILTTEMRGSRFKLKTRLQVGSNVTSLDYDGHLEKVLASAILVGENCLKHTCKGLIRRHFSK
jgi:hypothetical protein